jgi:hypothetical protein
MQMVMVAMPETVEHQKAAGKTDPSKTWVRKVASTGALPPKMACAEKVVGVA